MIQSIQTHRVLIEIYIYIYMYMYMYNYIVSHFMKKEGKVVQGGGLTIYIYIYVYVWC